VIIFKLRSIKMSVKRFCISLFALLTLSAAAAFAHQNGPRPGTHITVAKATSNLGDYKATYTSIQQAVNNARPGQVIEILDEAEYAEQVTIDGREDRQWPAPAGGIAPVGGKNGITIKYVPPSGAAISARPTIKYKDETNITPRNVTQARTQGDAVGASGNFETNGALRIIRASGVTIEGLIIDGGGSSPFGYDNVWLPLVCQQKKYTKLQHGNAAVALAISHNVQIRDCQLTNAYFGIYVKDRNTGGIFGNPNPADNDVTIPLSGFGQTGNHLIEYNRIHKNDVGLFFESCWDLASTVRYNLIYNNYHRATVAGAGDDSDKSAGAMIFKDMYITPLAIYNNTFYNNAAHLIGMWKVGYQHLIFNNIFAGRLQTGTYGNGGTSGYMAIEHMFANRMKHCVFSADQAPNGPPYYSVQFEQNRLGQPTGNPVQPGASLPGNAQGTSIAIPATANVRWLETPFSNTTETAGNFLEPNWSDAGVTAYIKGYGWPDAGILNANGSVADLGAISNDPTSKRPCDGKAQVSRARVSPYGFVTITGTTARAKITISQEVGTLTDLTVKYIRWITPVPANDTIRAQGPCDDDGPASFGNSGLPVPVGSVRAVTAAPPTGGWKVGANQSDITITGTAGQYGFFEVIFQGKDANGNVVTDVGFLPYRQLDYYLDIKVLKGTTAVTEVVAGEQVTLRVTAMDRAKNTMFVGGGTGNTQSTMPLVVAYSLSSAPTSRIFLSTGIALVEDDIRPPSNTYTKDYTVYFTKADASEVITGAGQWCNGDCAAASTTQRIPFPGDLVIKVRPGPPDKVVFQDPVPKSQLAGGTPATIVGTYPVVVQVQDKYDNPVDTKVDVTMTCLHEDIGCVESKTSSTDAATGNAGFTATVANGKTNDIFDLRASYGTITPDTGSLRVGRATDLLWVLYDGSYKPAAPQKPGDWRPDLDVAWPEDASVKRYYPVWIYLVGGDTLLGKNANVCVTSSNPNIKFSAADGGAAVAGPYMTALTKGVATFWITSDVAVDGATLTAEAKTTADCGGVKDNSIGERSRGGITFDMPDGAADVAFVKGDEYARPNYMEVTFSGDTSAGGFVGGGWNIPSKVTLRWPSNCGSAPVVEASTITAKSAGTISVTFSASGFPEGYSGVPSSQSGALVTIYDAINTGNEASPKTLVDSIGPLIARPRDIFCDDAAAQFSGPTFNENVNSGTTPDTLYLQITETLKDPQALVGNSLLMSSNSAGDGEGPLNVTFVDIVGGKYLIVVSPATPLKDDYWIKFNSAHTGIADAAGNPALPNNRRVQITQQEAPAAIMDAWYTTVDATGKTDYLYITFDKTLTDADIQSWFVGGNFKFDWGNVKSGGAGFSVNANNVNAISLYFEGPVSAAGSKTIRIDLATAFPETRNTFQTGGEMKIDGTFGNAKSVWGNFTKYARDEARPVLVRAELHIGTVDGNDNYMADTLVLWYSEGLHEDISTISQPVRLLGESGGDGNPVTVNTSVAITQVTDRENSAYTVVRYVVTKIEHANGDQPKTGDLVRINPSSSPLVSDKVTPANEQNMSDNRPVPLIIIPGEPNWQTKVRNNPFSDRNGGSVTIATTPNAKGDELTVRGQITLYDNMGKLVVDTVVTNVAGKGNVVEWTWYGKNRAGRVVGTGTYLFKAKYFATQKDGTKVGDPEVVSKSVGFVRGWGGK
jgi:hypothetical protein